MRPTTSKGVKLYTAGGRAPTSRSRGHAVRAGHDLPRQKAKFLGLNAATLYDIEVPAEIQVAADKEEVAIGSEPVSAA